jgi:hypothetical protein
MNSTPHTTATRFFFPERYAEKRPFWFRDAYVLTLLRRGGFAGIDPKSPPRYYDYARQLLKAPPIAAAMARERISLDTYKA